MEFIMKEVASHVLKEWEKFQKWGENIRGIRNSMSKDFKAEN